MINNNSKIKKSIVINSIGSFTYLFCQWLITYIIIWNMGYKDAGIYSLAMSIGNTFFSFAVFGMRNYQSSDLNNKHDEKTYIYSRIITSILSILFCIVYTIFKGYDFYTNLCINFFLVFKISEAIVDLTNGSLQKKWLYKYIGVSYICRGLISIITFFLSLILFKNLLLSIIIMSIFVYFFVYFYDIKVYKKNITILGCFNINNIKTLLFVCTPLALFLIINSFSIAYPRVVIESQLGDEILGIYTSYANIAIIIQVAANFIITPFITYFAELKANNKIKKLIFETIKCTLTIVIFGIFIYILSVFLGENIFNFVFSSNLNNYYYLFGQMILISIAAALSAFYSGLLIVYRKFLALLIINLINLLEILLFSNYCIINYGLKGINLLIIYSYLSIIIIYIIYIIFIIRKESKNV